MLAHAQLSVVALAALAACAAARPDLNANNKYNPVKSSKLNAVRTLQNTELANAIGSNYPTSVGFQDTIIFEGHTDEAPNPNPETQSVTPDVDHELKEKEAEKLKSVSASPQHPVTLEPVIPALFRDDSKPVNLRYPHAVLFGGTCGGSIIHPKWILTAGHCTLFTGGRYVLAGTNNSDDGSGVTKKVKKLYIHPNFSVGPYWLNAANYDIKQVAARWDFMLAELEEPLELNGETIASVPLEDNRRLKPNTYVGYAGYGTDHHGGFMRSEMHAMHLRTQTNSTCRKLEQFDGEDMICAQGYTPRFDSACNGDSGSGLVTGSGKLVGVASWVENDALECRNGNLVVFSKVARVRDWIRKVAGV